MESGSKKYGLLVPKKKLGGVKASNVFGDDSDSENDLKNKPIQTSNQTKAQQRSAKLIHDMALEEDATVFQYDEVYDEIEKKKENLDEKKKQIDKKPRYIQNLLVQAEKRKIEYERRNERLIQKERETEGNEFKDKEAFVTSSYKKKLEELKKLDEEDLKLS
ncbi:nuclear speckle splicing regulatory protein 1-like, partial [Sipha flava]|uniref:Nuclear speckle splicing regulatory protein 1-like n=1 Tax=Sipha flava TaxID=143950 RepID=A0A8B8FGP6_9HEMI